MSPVYSENSTILISHIIYDLIRSHISLLFYSCLVPLAGFICWLGTDIVVFPCGCFLLKSFPGTSSTILGFNSSLVSVFEFGARTSFVLGNSIDLQRACFSILVGLDRFWSCSCCSIFLLTAFSQTPHTILSRKRWSFKIPNSQVSARARKAVTYVSTDSVFLENGYWICISRKWY